MFNQGDFDNVIRMNKRISQKKLNGQILLMQTNLMNKFATIDVETKPMDQLGFPVNNYHEQPDALQSLISKSKDITKLHAKQIEHMKKAQQRTPTKVKREGQGTFLTGLGMATENRKRKESVSTQGMMVPSETDPDLMLKELIVKEGRDDLDELRKMIRETSSNLEGCSRKLNKNKKSILMMADRYRGEMSYGTMNVLDRYEQFEARRLEDAQYIRKW